MKKMRIAFIVSESFNLGAGYVIAYLKKIGHEVRLFLEPFSSLLHSEFKPDLVCFSCITANKDWALSMARTIKSFMETRILFGGVHPTLCPEDFPDNEVCVGSGEEYFGGKFDPDNLWAEREMFLEQLPPVHRAYQIFMTGFGCPFRCSFCNNHQLQRKLYRRSVDGCIIELMNLKKNGLKYVLFDDDIFTLNKNWLFDFLANYRVFIDLPFTCFGHAKVMDNEIAKELKTSKCECVWLGVQTGDDVARKQILNRQETNQEIALACQAIKRNGLKLMIDHIFGIPNDNIVNSYNFYKTLKPDVVNCYELLYFPKAEINKFGNSQALYQREGGLDYQRYAKSFSSLPLRYN